MLKIVEANIDHIEQLTLLFDQYRIFYNQSSDLQGAKNFLEQRIKHKESVIFLAYNNDDPVGFTQLYTSFSSVSMQAIYILNDLFVSQNARKKGIGEALLTRAKKICIEKGYKGLALETGIDNPAQKLYEKLDWKKDTSSFHYFWASN
jgi:GNAT superfamily N-acetyltransferase